MLELAAAVPLSVARNAIADCVLGNRDTTPFRIGDITLHPHQRSAVTRIRSMLAAHGGALLCDDVGLGKTFIALAIAGSFDSVVVVAPAVLLGMWRRALDSTRVQATVVSLESLGRSRTAALHHSFVVVDEAHHFRNCCTRRYSALAQACALSPVLLLTATPVHNSRQDLTSLIALFSGSRAYTMSDAELASVIVRRSHEIGTVAQQIPAIYHAPRRVIITDEDILDRIVALPRAVPPSGGGIATTLVVNGLVRQWVSSNAALHGALKRRVARSRSLLSALDAGRYPTAAELAAWVYTGDAVQLAFTELLDPAATSLQELADVLREHVAALEQLVGHVSRLDDASLVGFVREIRAVHRNERVVAFTSYAETAEALYHGLKLQGHVALLTARAAMIASGPVSRAEVLRQFSADDVFAAAIPDHQRIDVLIATDVLSEGVDLHGASVVVHLDLPWTDARVKQREGRLARLGSRHARVMAYAVDPPPRANAVLRELELLATKSSLHTALVGSEDLSHASGVREPSQVRAGERVRAILEQWQAAAEQPRVFDRPCIGHARTTRTFALGAWLVDGVPMMLVRFATTGVGGETTDDSREIGCALDILENATDLHPVVRAESWLEDVTRSALEWYHHRCARAMVGASQGDARAQSCRNAPRTLVRVADSTASHGRFARRAHFAAMAGRLRRAAHLPLPVAVEWSLESLCESVDEASVNAILEFVERAQAGVPRPETTGLECVALILGSAAPSPGC